MHDFNRTVKQVIKVVKVCESTVRKRQGLLVCLILLVNRHAVVVFVCKVVSDFANFSLDETCVYVNVCVCASLASDSSETI